MTFPKRPIAFSALGLFLMADRFLKWLALAHPEQEKHLLDNFWFFGYYPNPHFLFFLNLPLLLNLGAILAAFIFLWLFFSSQPPSSRLPFYFVLTGGLSNFYDRASYGVVIDFFNLFNLSTFNLADLLIFSGLIIFVVQFYRDGKIKNQINLLN